MLLHIDDAIINTDHIRSAVHRPAADGRMAMTEVLYTDGSTGLLDCDFDQLASVCGVITPAAPGYRVLRGHCHEGEEPECFFDEYPVIAFRLFADGDRWWPTPLIPGAVFGLDDVLVAPGGRCHCLDDQWESVEAWQRDFIGRRSRAAA